MQSYIDLNFINITMENAIVDNPVIDNPVIDNPVSSSILPGDDNINIVELEIIDHDYNQNINLEILSDDNDDNQIDWNTTELMIYNKSIIDQDEDDIKTVSDTNSDIDIGLLLNIKKLELNDHSLSKFRFPFDNDDDEEVNFSDFSYNNDNQEEEEEEEEEENEEEEEEDDEEYENTLDTIKKLVENQMEVRKLMLKEIVKGYLKPFKDNETFRMSFVLATTQQIKKIVKILNMENEVIVIIADILFNKKIVEDMQVYNYKSLLKPFLENSSSQRNFLNFILQFVNKHKQLINIDNINDIFQEIYSNKLVHSFVFVNWYHTLNNSSLHKKLEIDFGITDAVFNYLEDIISNLEH